MKRRRDSPLPIIVGLLFAGAVHLAAAPPASNWLSRSRRSPLPPDLRVEAIHVPDDVLVLTGPNTIRFDVANRGQTATPDVTWEDRVYLSSDNQLDADDAMLISTVHVGALAPGEGYRAEVRSLKLPSDVKPPFFLLFQTDARNAVDERWLENNNVRARQFDPSAEQDDTQPQIAVGKPDAPQRVTVAWISYEDFRELVAPQSETEQPAIQNVAEPVPAAPMNPDPTPPRTDPAPPESESRTPAEAGGTLAEAASPAPPTAPPLPHLNGSDAAIAPQPGPSAPAQPDIQHAPGEGDSAADAAPAASDEDKPAKPTQTPRDEGEASPTQRYPRRVDIQPGGTIVGQGIEIKTARPNFSAVARASTLPDNPEAELTFDRTGSVIDARIVKTSGSPNIDAPILRCFYRWKAKGKQIDDMPDDGKLILPVRVILRE